MKSNKSVPKVVLSLSKKRLFQIILPLVYLLFCFTTAGTLSILSIVPGLMICSWIQDFILYFKGFNNACVYSFFPVSVTFLLLYILGAILDAIRLSLVKKSRRK